MITAAKLADNLSLNMWSAKTSKGATIQDALDYTMTLDPGEEDVTELAPWVAAVAAAYGDPAGKYEKWLRNKENTGDEGKVQSWRFYNDVYAFYSSPARGNTKSSQQKPS